MIKSWGFLVPNVKVQQFHNCFEINQGNFYIRTHYDNIALIPKTYPWGKRSANVTQETCCFFPSAVRMYVLKSSLFFSAAFCTHTAAVLYYATTISATHPRSQILYQFADNYSATFLSKLCVVWICIVSNSTGQLQTIIFHTSCTSLCNLCTARPLLNSASAVLVTSPLL